MDNGVAEEVASTLVKDQKPIGAIWIMKWKYLTTQEKEEHKTITKSMRSWQ